MDFNGIKALDKKYIANTYNRFDRLFTSGKGSELYDEKGKRYIDLSAGIAVNTFGTADPLWLEAVTKQLSSLSHISNLYYTEPQAILAKKLCERTQMKKVFFSNSGAEANECAIKAARKYSHDKYGEGRNTIITLKDSFHGRTITTLSATGQEVFHKDFYPFTEGFIYSDPEDIQGIRKLMEDHKACAVMMELIQGEGGVRVLSKDFVQEVASFAKEKDILVIVDEVQTGNGRTGELYSYMNYDIAPDIISTAKGLAGGLPFGATLFGEKTEAVLSSGSHGSTFGGNPVSAAGAISIIDRLTDTFLDEVVSKGEFIKKELASVPGVVAVTGMGLMLGIETVRPAKEIVERALEEGLVVITAKNKVRLLPPLNISMELLQEAIEILKGVIEV
ncbi:aspartate aminotransferase family protein [Alloiococcus sp. CFN-8]|uniref:aspartate aminotransferase family protein n=1 Tax=Alloiococcus sp. CFN-8 TaxID=3416081 RepID=UPI003CEB601D